jgi:hypothetical protein
VHHVQGFRMRVSWDVPSERASLRTISNHYRQPFPSGKIIMCDFLTFATSFQPCLGSDPHPLERCTSTSLCTTSPSATLCSALAISRGVVAYNAKSSNTCYPIHESLSPSTLKRATFRKTCILALVLLCSHLSWFFFLRPHRVLPHPPQIPNHLPQNPKTTLMHPCTPTPHTTCHQPLNPTP